VTSVIILQSLRMPLESTEIKNMPSLCITVDCVNSKQQTQMFSEIIDLRSMKANKMHLKRKSFVHLLSVSLLVISIVLTAVTDNLENKGKKSTVVKRDIRMAFVLSGIKDSVNKKIFVGSSMKKFLSVGLD
jgi:hypothetical protein